MRNMLFVLAAISVLLMCASVYQAIKTSGISRSSRGLTIHDLKGFEDNGPNSSAFKALREKFNNKVTAGRNKERKANTWWLVVNFIVTGLTAASTLVSTISAAKSKESVPVKTVVIIAILTFLATLAGWGNAQLTDTKTKTIEAIQAVKDLRSSFYTDYQQEQSENKKAAIIESYDDKLNDL